MNPSSFTNSTFTISAHSKKNPEESFRVLMEKQLSSLINRLKRKAKETHTPPDEETYALGKQTGHVFLSMYFASTHDARNRNVWKKQGTVIMDAFLENDAGNAGRLSSGFFHEIANDPRLLLLLGAPAAADDDVLVGGAGSRSSSVEKDDEGEDGDEEDVPNDLVHWWLQCLTLLNSNANVHAHAHGTLVVEDWNRNRRYSKILAAGIRSYAIFSFGQYRNFAKIAERRKKDDPFHLVSLYEKLDASAQQFLIRQCVHVSSFGSLSLPIQDSVGYDDARIIIGFVSPLFYRVVVSSMLSSTDCEREHARLFVMLILDKVRNVIATMTATTTTTTTRNSNSTTRRKFCIVMIDWLTQSLEVFLKSSLDQASLDHIHAALGIGHDFLRQLCEVVAQATTSCGIGDGDCDSCHDEEKDAMTKCRHRFLCAVLGRILPNFVKHSTFTVDDPCLESVLGNIKAVMLHDDGGSGVMVPLPNEVFYNIGIVSLMVQDECDIVCLLEILSLAAQNLQPTCQAQIMVYGLLASIGFVFQSLPSCSKVATNLIHSAKKSLDLLYNRQENDDIAAQEQELLDECIKDEDQTRHVYDLFCDEVSITAKLESLTTQLGHFEQKFTVENQCESLLLGLSLLYTSRVESTMKTVLSYLRHLIDHYLHLGRRCLPVLVATLQNYINWDHDHHQEESSSHEVISALFEFMCSCVAKDPSCAHEVWSILSSMTTEMIPVNVQAMTIRLYPLLCKSNKRLYSRIHTSLSNYVSHLNASLRIAAAASLCDLAKDDLIRDVSEIIGWVQTFLTDENQLVIYFAVTTLYHLIMAEELDFSTVIKVMNKKLVPIDDVQAMVQLPCIVVEALVQLMGVGEVSAAASDSDDDSSGDGSGPSEIVISQQVQDAMSGLLNLSVHIAGSMLSENPQEKELDVDGNLRILSIINFSIAKYSFERMGLSHDMVRRECKETFEYDRMKQVIEMSFDASEKYMDNKDANFDMNLIALTRKLVLFEEDVLGPSLWSYKKNNYSQKNQGCTSMSAALKAIPESAEGTITCFLVKKLVERAGSALNHPSRLSLSLACLQELALPSPFVGLLRKTMDTDVGEKEILTGPCVDLLIAQLRIMRRAADERREYVKFSIELSQLPSELFFIELWKYAPQFLESLSVIIPQWTTATAEELIPYVWSHCSDKLDGDGALYAAAFLKSLANILELKDKKMSPMMIKAIYKVVINDALPQIGAGLRKNLNEHLQRALFNCISKIPFQVLHEHRIFDLVNDTGIRIQLICFLHDQGILEQEDPHFIRALLWVGKEKSTPSSNDELFLWNLSFDLSRVAMKISVKNRSEILTNLLEIMQVYGVSSTNLHLILLLSSRWVQDYPLLMQSPALFHPYLILCDQKLGKLSNLLNLSSRFMKSVLMVLEGTLKGGGQEKESVDVNALRECFFNIFISLKSSESTSLHALVSSSQVFVQ